MVQLLYLQKFKELAYSSILVYLINKNSDSGGNSSQ